jgi:hypothetical protein
MRATEIIRGVLDLIDQVECAQQEQPADPVGGAFAQLFAQMTEPSQETQGYDNSPDPHVQGIEAVTTAAGLGGLNGPKNPADIRSNSVSMYPGFQAENKGQ